MLSYDIDPAIYYIQAITEGCDASDEGNYSAPLTITAAKWGDVVGYHDIPNGIWTAPNGTADIIDQVAIIQKYMNELDAPIKSRADIESWPNEEVDFMVNMADVLSMMAAFLHSPYPFPGPSTCGGGG